MRNNTKSLISLRRACLAAVLAYLPTALPAAEPAAVAPTMSLAQIDATLPNMRALVADMPRLVGNPAPDHTGRRLEQDIDEILLQPSYLQRATELRAELQRSLPEGTDRVPRESLRALAQLHTTEMCRIALLGSYWQVSKIRDYHRNLLLKQIGQRPQLIQPDLQAQLVGIDARAHELRQKAATLTTDECSGEKDRARAMSEVNAVIAALNDLRRRISEMDPGLPDESAPTLTVRSIPCRPAAPGTTGVPQPKLRESPDVSDYYPEVLRRFTVEGLVRIAVDIDATGCVVAAGINRSSGVELLDEAGIRVAFEMQFTPGEIAGKPVGGRHVMPFRFQLPPPSDIPVLERSAQPQP
jgi:TonB family protein